MHMNIRCGTLVSPGRWRRGARISAFALGGVFINLIAAQETITLSFRDSVLVNDTTFTIGDIARLSGGDASMRERITAIVAGTSAPPGYARFISTTEYITGLLAAEFPGMPITTAGAKRPLIRTDYRMVRIADYEADLRSYIAAAIGWKAGEWQVAIGNLSDSCKVLDELPVVSFGGLDNRFSKGNTNVTLKLRQGTRTWRLPVRCRFTVSAPVLVTNAAIGRGQTITPDLCELRTMDITHFAPSPITSPEQLLGKKAARSIDPGTILHDRLLTAIPIVEKGDAGSIMITRGRISIAVTGIARERGSVGDRIWVENSETRKLIRTEILEKGKVTPLQGGVSI